MSFYPSVRECLERRKQLADTPQLIEALQELGVLDADREGSPPFPEITRAVDRMRQVWQLVNDMAANLGAGMALPPTPQIGQRKTETTDNTAVQKAPVTHIRAAACPPVPQPPDTYSVEQMLERMKVSRSVFYAMRSAKEVPPPTIKRGVRKYWLKSQVEHLFPQEGTNHG